MMSFGKHIGAALLLAAAYFGAGQLGLLFAVPPGYASPVWPASGIALGALLLFGLRLWPGVLLGSLLVNAGTFAGGSSAPALGSLAVAAGIGLGAALQALLGAVLVRRFASFPGPLTNERDISAFLLLGAPVACLLNATVAVGALALTGTIDRSAVAQSWWTWWIGDSIGVLLVCPLIVVWLGPAAQWRQRRRHITVPLLTMFAAAALLLAFEPASSYVLEDRKSTGLLVLAGGLVLSLLVSGGALIQTGRNAEIAALVQSRTEELARSNAQLATEIDQHVLTERALAHERNFFKTLLENLSDGIVVFDTSGATVIANRAARETHMRIAGTPEWTGNWGGHYELCRADGKTPIPTEQLPRCRALRGETVRNFEMIALAPNRTPVALLVTAQPLTDPAGQRSGGISIVRDITEERKADLLKSEFVSVVSHELRTPLTSIVGSLSLLRGGAAGSVSEKAAKLIDIAFRNAERLTLLINDILDIEKIESGELRLRLRRQALQPIVQQAHDANAGYAHSCHVTLVLTQPALDLHVAVDENRLLQVLANLLSNAAKFSTAGAEVKITVVARDATVRIEVEDRGPGIAPEFQGRIFQKFSQADSSDARAKAGTGLGLAISRALVERMNGRIGYTTEVGAGSVFYVELPIAEEGLGARGMGHGPEDERQKTELEQI